MKKLNKIKLQDAVVLENQEMKMIFGGSGAGSNCSATCADGSTVSISNCNGTCTAQDATTNSDGYVECVGSTKTLTKSCGGSSGAL